MKILVTGGMGFVGKFVVNSLIEKKYNVTIFDNFSNSNHLSSTEFINKGVKVIDGDITKIKEVMNAIKDHQIVIHLAAKISVDESIINPIKTFQINVDGTNNVIDACKKNHVKKIIFASSAAVYGEGVSNNKSDEKSKTNPISPYGESKIMMEEQIRKNIGKNINYVILRFFNIYGIGQSPEYAGVITKFIEKINRNESLEIFGDGMQTRDFVSIQDIINSIHNAINYNKNGVFNIASGNTITIKELSKLMILLSGKKIDVIHLPSKKGDIKHSSADISLAKENLGYIPHIDLKDGIKDLLNANN